MLRLSTLRELGGAQEIVRTHLDGALTALPDESRDAALDLFRYLVTPSGPKIVYAASDLAQMTERPEGQVADLLAHLAQGDTRIVRHVPPPPGRAAPDDRYEIFHDVLAPAIIDWRRRALEERKTAEEARERERLEAEKRSAEQLARRERRRVRALGALAVGLLALVAIAAVAVVFAEREKTGPTSSSAPTSHASSRLKPSAVSTTIPLRRRCSASRRTGSPPRRTRAARC